MMNSAVVVFLTVLAVAVCTENPKCIEHGDVDFPQKCERSNYGSGSLFPCCEDATLTPTHKVVRNLNERPRWECECTLRVGLEPRPPRYSTMDNTWDRQVPRVPHVSLEEMRRRNLAFDEWRKGMPSDLYERREWIRTHPLPTFPPNPEPTAPVPSTPEPTSETLPQPQLPSENLGNFAGPETVSMHDLREHSRAVREWLDNMPSNWRERVDYIRTHPQPTMTPRDDLPSPFRRTLLPTGATFSQLPSRNADRAGWLRERQDANRDSLNEWERGLPTWYSGYNSASEFSNLPTLHGGLTASEIGRQFGRPYTSH